MVTKAQKAAQTRKANAAAKHATAAVVTQLAPAPAPAPAPAVPPVTIALRGGLAFSTVKLTGKAYRVGAAHNVAWWQQVTQAIAAGGGTATVTSLVNDQKVPAIFVGYVIRRGYLQGA